MGRPKKNPFKVSLKSGELEYNGEGATAEAAIEDIKPQIMKGLSYLKLENEGKVSEMRLNPLQVRRFGYSKTVRQVFAKQLTFKLK